MPAITVKVEGLDRVLRALKSSPSQMRSAANNAIRRSIYVILNRALPITPIDTGALRGKEASGVSFKDFYGEIFPDIEYAAYVHEGTYKMTARPFLKNAVDSELNEVERIFKDEISKGLDNIARSAV